MSDDTTIGRPKKLENADAVSAYIEAKDKIRLQEIADEKAGGNMAHLIRDILLAYLESNG